MNSPQNLSSNTKTYLERFRCILNEMIQKMTKAELSQSISHNFIVQMIPHHMAAIAMSQNILCYTTCIPVEEIASGIVAEQTKSIERMKRIEACCSCQKNSPQAVNRYQGRVCEIMQNMFWRMGNACADNDINADFMREMIPHHEGAIELCENALRYEICPELKPILKAILVSQKRGISQMEKLLSCMGSF